MKGFSTADICDIFLISETNFFNIVAKYREGGIDVVDDQRKSNGANPKFDQEELEEAKKLLARTHPHGGIWTAREIMEYLQENYPEKNLPKKKLGTTSLYY